MLHSRIKIYGAWTRQNGHNTCDQRGPTRKQRRYQHVGAAFEFFYYLFYFYFFLIYGFTLTRADSRRTRPIRPELGGIGRRPKLIETAETGRNRP